MRERGLDGQRVAHFLVQCLFCIFAEDENLLPGSVFTEILKSAGSDADKAGKRINKLFAAMQQKTGGEYGDHDIAWFNGGLFKTIAVPALTTEPICLRCTPPPRTWTGEPSTPPSSAPSSSAASILPPVLRSALTTLTPAPSPSSSIR